MMLREPGSKQTNSSAPACGSSAKDGCQNPPVQAHRLKYPRAWVAHLRPALQECNLYQLMKTCQGLLPEALVREWCATILQGLAYIHERGFFHRDLKPGALSCP